VLGETVGGLVAADAAEGHEDSDLELAPRRVEGAACSVLADSTELAEDADGAETELVVGVWSL